MQRYSNVKEECSEGNATSQKAESELRKTNRFSNANIFSYDVQKTDSLVAPYVGVLKFEDGAGNEKDTWTIDHVFQEGKWIYKSNSYSSTAKLLAWVDQINRQLMADAASKWRRQKTEMDDTRLTARRRPWEPF